MPFSACSSRNIRRAGCWPLLAPGQEDLTAAQLALDDARSYAELIAQGAPCDDAGVLTTDVVLPLKLDQACASVRNAVLAVENTRLLAPLSGVLTSFNLVVGQSAGSGAAAGAIGAALTVGVRGGGVLISLLVLPLYVPVLIFGAGAVDASTIGMEAAGHLSILGALLLLGMVLAPWATAAALRISLE